MIEIKNEPYPNPSVQSRRIKKRLEELNPGKDVHLMGLYPEMFTMFDFLPSSAFIPIARVRVNRFSRLVKKWGWGGIAGHYLLAPNKIITWHHRLGQDVGTGFADSRRCLFREVTRKVNWVFSNRAEQMQALCGRYQS
jgi:glycerophosphoryl diester phosphodiesterase